MQGIVIQGPTTFAKEIAASYKAIDNIVWSTWDDEPQDKIKIIKESGIDIVLSKKPSISGYGNINMQTVSSNAGIQYLKNKGIQGILKVRSDIKINKPKLLLKILLGKKLSFLYTCKPKVRPIYYHLVYEHTSFDFPCDFIIYGDVNRIEKCFNFTTDRNIPIPAEALIVYYYCKQSDIDFNLEYDYLIKNDITFFANECIENHIEIDWLKREQKNYLMIAAMDDKCHIY